MYYKKNQGEAKIKQKLSIKQKMKQSKDDKKISKISHVMEQSFTDFGRSTVRNTQRGFDIGRVQSCVLRLPKY
jgi:hypothetical protein